MAESGVGFCRGIKPPAHAPARGSAERCRLPQGVPATAPHIVGVEEPMKRKFLLVPLQKMRLELHRFIQKCAIKIPALGAVYTPVTTLQLFNIFNHSLQDNTAATAWLFSWIISYRISLCLYIRFIGCRIYFDGRPIYRGHPKKVPFRGQLYSIWPSCRSYP